MPIRRTWVAALLHAGTQGAGYYWPKKLQVPQEHAGMAGRSSWLDVSIPAFMAKGGQEQSRKLQEEPKGTEE